MFSLLLPWKTTNLLHFHLCLTNKYVRMLQREKISYQIIMENENINYVCISFYMFRSYKNIITSILYYVWFVTVTEPPNSYKRKYGCPRLTCWRAHTFTYINPVVRRVSQKTSVNQHHNQDRTIKQIHITYMEFATEMILQ